MQSSIQDQLQGVFPSVSATKKVRALLCKYSILRILHPCYIVQCHVPTEKFKCYVCECIASNFLHLLCISPDARNGRNKLFTIAK